ncbi:5'-3' exonuclease H3TH domain-containing protein [Luteimonas sp. MC1825]|uniref:5'-3' exonuclease n=1 Tax=Luteimonas sp. MC1825 TaxID=2761107 RepID=UPI001CC5634B|nr:5'-3' exonuclease H3TH domain-containing protein [Luteimonas sp. MC1825]
MSAPLPAPLPTLHLVDASLYVFRAWHSMPADGFHDADGWPTNAVHGFARFLLDLLERERPRHIAIAFDEALDSCFRNALYPAYKANRDPAPAELKRQFAYCKSLCVALGLPVLAHREYEADDLIGSALVQVRALGFRGVIVSADKDLSQLLATHDEQWDFARGVRWGAAGVKARQGVHAHQVADFLALSGDAVDNIPGVPGIGSKTAAVLLAHFGSLDALLERIDEVAFLRFRGAAQAAVRLREHREQALLCRQLSTVVLDAPIDDATAPFVRGNGDAGTLVALGDAVGFGPMTRRRLHAAAGLADAQDAPQHVGSVP